MKGTGCEEANETLKELKPRKSDVPTPTVPPTTGLGLGGPNLGGILSSSPLAPPTSHYHSAAPRESLRKKEAACSPAEKAKKRSLLLHAAAPRM